MNKCYDSVNNWLLDLPSGSIFHLVTGERRRLGEYQIKLLSVLMQEAGRILTREELTQMVWERRVIGNNSLPNAIHALRTALEDDGKQQKIIKTIPRKGYLLEPEYCRTVEKEAPGVSPAPEPIPDAEYQAEISVAHQPTAPEPIPSPPRVSRGRSILLVVLGLMLAAFVAILFTATLLRNSQGNTLHAQETQSGVYSNIRLFALDHDGNPTWEQDNLYSKLKDSLYILNQRLKAQKTSMNVYYLSENQTLNYTFSLTSRCDSRQLVMTIYHWRIDALRLNNVIVRETRRKLDEMAVCKAS